MNHNLEKTSPLFTTLTLALYPMTTTKCKGSAVMPHPVPIAINGNNPGDWDFFRRINGNATLTRLQPLRLSCEPQSPAPPVGPGCPAFDECLLHRPWFFLCSFPFILSVLFSFSFYLLFSSSSFHFSRFDFSTSFLSLSLNSWTDHLVGRPVHVPEILTASGSLKTFSKCRSVSLKK